MTELEQFAADSDAAPPRIVLRHLQNQLLDLGIETWPTRTTPATECRPLLLTNSRCQPRTVSGCTSIPTRAARFTTAHDAKLVPEKKQLRFRVVDSQPHINQIESSRSKEYTKAKSIRCRNPNSSRVAKIGRFVRALGGRALSKSRA